MAEFIRVRDKATGHEYTIREDRFDEKGHTRLEKDALGPDRLPAPVKFKTTVAKSAAAKSDTTSGQKAGSKKES
jgi:hypothetical protein